MSGKRLATVESDEFSDDSDMESNDESLWSNGKLSNNKVANKRLKQYSSSDLNEPFQNYQLPKRNGDVHLNKRRRPNESNLPDRRRKCFSKNALMARENRLKKKLYVQNLEATLEKIRDENKKLSSILNNQSHVVSDLRKEVKYFKSILANSKDISNLLRCINQSTGLPVSTSINTNFTIEKEDEIEKSLHPWSETSRVKKEENYFNLLNGELPLSPVSDFKSDMNWDTLFSDLNSPVTIDDYSNQHEHQTLISEENAAEETVKEPKKQLCSEHNYTSTIPDLSDVYDNVGICLHIAQHKVSLEFCSSCSEKAMLSWGED